MHSVRPDNRQVSDDISRAVGSEAHESRQIPVTLMQLLLRKATTAILVGGKAGLSTTYMQLETALGTVRGLRRMKTLQ